MTEKVLIHERCLALQLVRDLPPPFVRSQTSTHRLPPQLPNGTCNASPTRQACRPSQYGSLRRPKSQDPPNHDAYTHKAASVPNSPMKSAVTNPMPSARRNSSTDSGTPTPTNPAPLLGNTLPSSPIRTFGSSSINAYQDGLLLFQSWVAVNAACVWDEELVRAVKGAHFVGILVGGYLLIGGPSRLLAAVCHAHSRALLSPPPGWVIVLLGEIRECEVSVVARGQFTPLGDALCWVINRLNTLGQGADQVTVRNALLVHFPAMIPPEPALVHAAISDLIRQRKVFHSVKGYGIVKLETYAPGPAMSPKVKLVQTVPKLLTTSEALTKAHGDTVFEPNGNFTHAAVQTDLADLLSGTWPDSAVITPSKLSSHSHNNTFQRTGSLREAFPYSLGSSPSSSEQKTKVALYTDVNYSDITVKGGEKGSIISKLLRVSAPRNRLASFSGQFPPPQWNNPDQTVKHFHSVATQTQSSKSMGTESCWLGNTYWMPRSSTLPRRPSRAMVASCASPNARPHSTSPSHAKMSKKPMKTNQNSSIKSSSPSLCDSSHTSRNQLDSAEHPNTVKGILSHSRQPTMPTVDRSQHTRQRSLTKPINRKPLEESLRANDNFYSSESERRSSTSCETDTSVTFAPKPTNHLSLPRRLHTAKPPQNPPMSASQNDIVKVSRPRASLIVDNQRICKPDRSGLQLSLKDSHMNNAKHIIRSPQKPEGLQKNVLNNRLPCITKGSASDLTYKNLGYVEVDKSKKKMYTNHSSDTADTEESSSVDIPPKPKLQLIINDNNKNESNAKLTDIIVLDNQCGLPVKAFPSLSNLNFSSLAAQKIMQGVSMNSIDTIVEVNMVAEKMKSPLQERMTNTDFGFV